MNDKNLFQIVYDVLGYSPGGFPGKEFLILPINHKDNLDKINEINDRFKKLIDFSNEQNKKAIEKDSKKKLNYVIVKGI